MKIELLTVGPLEENCYLVIDESTNRAVLIDPGEIGRASCRERVSFLV